MEIHLDAAGVFATSQRLEDGFDVQHRQSVHGGPPRKSPPEPDMPAAPRPASQQGARRERAAQPFVFGQASWSALYRLWARFSSSWVLFSASWTLAAAADQAAASLALSSWAMDSDS
jgi:hypothetical protein